MADEKEVSFYSDNRGVRITNTRAIIGNTTYAMANITSVAMGKIPPKVGGWVFLAIVGALLSVAGFAVNVWPLAVGGIVLTALCIWLAVRAKPTYAVLVGSASGSAHAVKSKDKGYIQSIVTAMNEAFIKRG